jgi:hypothetical protein
MSRIQSLVSIRWRQNIRSQLDAQIILDHDSRMRLGGAKTKKDAIDLSSLSTSILDDVHNDSSFVLICKVSDLGLNMFTSVSIGERGRILKGQKAYVFFFLVARKTNVRRDN